MIDNSDIVLWALAAYTLGAMNEWVAHRGLGSRRRPVQVLEHVAVIWAITGFWYAVLWVSRALVS